MLFLAIFYSPCKWFNRFSSPTSLLEMMKSCGFSVYYFPFLLRSVPLLYPSTSVSHLPSMKSN
ncbi:hypothetical protein DB729_001045 [Streptococcus halitosis]|uniref:Uncharacterized protein n=2 Tax=Streptococcus TaxID=1301 RepID=A0A1X1G532_STROR|nr:hypothetical protein [Streptococcus sp. CCUG 71758]ORO41979.1 hypothetical protein B7727_09170 [Streptococcus oralis subsp. tigurinus]RRN46900.1 hypothetical protein DB729_001045 [Streptococcus halitosis]